MKRRSFITAILAGLASIPLVKSLVAAPVETPKADDWLIQYPSIEHKELVNLLSVDNYDEAMRLSNLKIAQYRDI